MEITNLMKEENGSMENLNAAVTQNEVSSELQVLFSVVPSDLRNQTLLFADVSNRALSSTDENCMVVSSVDLEPVIESSNPDWDRARLEDRKRAWAKYHIVKAFVKYRFEQKIKGINYDESGKCFARKLHIGEFCRDETNILKDSNIAFTTIRRWERNLRNSGDMNSPVSLLEGFRFCGRQSTIDTFDYHCID